MEESGKSKDWFYIALLSALPGCALASLFFFSACAMLNMRVNIFSSRSVLPTLFSIALNRIPLLLAKLFPITPCGTVCSVSSNAAPSLSFPFAPPENFCLKKQHLKTTYSGCNFGPDLKEFYFIFTDFYVGLAHNKFFSGSRGDEC